MDISELVPGWSQGMSLDELAQKLAELPKEARDEIVATAEAFTANMRWLPSPGPQELAFFSKADLLLFGGSGGAGKSDLLLGLATTAHRKSLIMRAQFSDLDALTERAIAINGSRAGFNGASPPTLRTVDGRLIIFTGAVADKWQGQPFDLKCVGAGTPVWMADGSKKPVEDIAVGDVVETIDGPRRVSKVFPPKRAGAVLATATDAHGIEIGSQIQGTDHRLLTERGWVSHDMSCGSHPCVTSSRRTTSGSPRSFSRSPQSIGKELRCLLFPMQDQRLGGLSFSLLLDLTRRLACFFSVGQLCPATNSLPSDGARQFCRLPRPRTRKSKQILPLDLLPYCRRLFAWLGSLNGSCDALISSLLPDSPGDCRSDRDFCGGRIPTAYGRPSLIEGALVCLRRQGDAEQSTPTYYLGDGQGSIPTHSRVLGAYDHPYRKEICESRQQVAICSLRCVPVGVRTLFDFEVESANSYITESGFVASNCFDEGAQMPEAVVDFHLGWLRDAVDPNQRTRAVIATNPPVNAQGDWLIKKFRPWLDITHDNPAKHGELRWYVRDPDGNDFEVPGPEPYQFPGQPRTVLPMSRTFIPGKLADNPYLARTGYAANLDNLPEPLRSAVRDGNFMAARQDQEFQVIPTDWVRAAQRRWEPGLEADIEMTAIGADVGAGGKDRVVLAPRHGEWYAPLIAVPGKKAPDGSTQAALIVQHRRDNAAVVVDVGGGYGGDCCGRLEANSIKPHKFNGSAGTTARALDGRLFVNCRAEAYWRFREALNPDQEGGSIVALPDDPEILTELTAVCYVPDIAKIQIESKVDVKKRLGRSPDKGDAIVMAWAPGAVAKQRLRFGGGNGGEGRPTSYDRGYSDVKRSFGGS